MTCHSRRTLSLDWSAGPGTGSSLHQMVEKWLVKLAGALWELVMRGEWGGGTG